MNRRHLIAIATAICISLCGAAMPAPALADGTSAVVVNQRDDSEVYRLMLQIRRTMGDTVDTTNLAAAVASCESCQTVAVSLQAVLVMSDPSVFVPENIALAMNVDCDMCQTLASAYQTLVQTGGPVHLTAEGDRQVAEIRQQLEAIRNAGLSIEEIQARVDELNWQLQQVLYTQVVAAGPPADTGATGTADTTAAAPANPETTTPSPSETDTTTTGAPGATPSETGTTTTPSGSGTTTTPTQTDTSTTPSDTGTSTTPTDTGTTTTPSDTTESGTQTAPTG